MRQVLVREGLMTPEEAVEMAERTWGKSRFNGNE
jgi:hypothetical protein